MKVGSYLKIFLTLIFIFSRTILVYPHAVDAKDLRPVFTIIYKSDITKFESKEIKTVTSQLKKDTQNFKQKRLRYYKKSTLVQPTIESPHTIFVATSPLVYQTEFTNFPLPNLDSIDRPPI